MPLFGYGVRTVCILVAIKIFPFSLHLLNVCKPFKTQWLLNKATKISVDTAERTQTSSVP
jgi:hypothetical protein